MSAQTFHLEGTTYVIVPKHEYERLATLAKAADLPELPRPDARGRIPAVAYARASLARKIIRDRVAAALSQKALAQAAGVRIETLCRLETSTHTPSLTTLDRIDRTLTTASARQSGRKKRRSGSRTALKARE